MSSREQSIVEAVRRYYNNPLTVRTFDRWAPDAKRRGVTAAHLGLDDVESIHKDLIRRFIEIFRHRKAVERMTKLIVTESQIEDGQTILDSGCGTGSIAFPIAERNPRSRVFGVSLSRTQLEIAGKYQQSARLQNTFFSEQDFSRMAFLDSSMDRVIFAESFCHAPDKRATIYEVNRVLKPGGKLIIFDPLYLKPPTSEQQPLCEALGDTEGLAMADLLSTQELVGYINGSGMETEYVFDLTSRAKASLALIANGYVRALIEGADPSALIDSYLAWHLLTHQGVLGYFVIRAVKPERT